MYIEEIIKFIDSISTIDQIGNLYKKKLKDDLKNFLYPVLKEKTQRRDHMKKIRDNILNILIKHRYIVENHPRRAGGGEATRTSFSIGPRYQEALKDYYRVKGRQGRDFQVEVLETERMDSDNLADIFPEQPRKYIIPEENLKGALSREIGDLYHNIFKIYHYIKQADFSTAIKIQMGVVKNFLRGVYRHFYNEDTVVQQRFNSFLTVLEKTEGFPYSKQELIDLIDTPHHINLDIVDVEEVAHNMYQSVSSFFQKINQFTSEE